MAARKHKSKQKNKQKHNQPAKNGRVSKTRDVKAKPALKNKKNGNGDLKVAPPSNRSLITIEHRSKARKAKEQKGQQKKGYEKVMVEMKSKETEIKEAHGCVSPI